MHQQYKISEVQKYTHTNFSSISVYTVEPMDTSISHRKCPYTTGVPLSRVPFPSGT